MSKEITLIIPDEAITLIVAHLSKDTGNKFKFGQATIGSDLLNSGRKVDLREVWKDEAEVAK